MRSWGWTWKTSEDQFTLLFQPEIFGEALGEKEFLQYLGQEQGGPPESILQLLATKACRSAIKFGDELSRSECVHMVRCLAQCQLPFQCAHGRPSVAHLHSLRGP